MNFLLDCITNPNCQCRQMHNRGCQESGDDLRIGGMAFLLTVFFEKLDMQGAIPIISICFTSELSRLLLSQYFQLNIALDPYITLKNSALQTISLCSSIP